MGQGGGMKGIVAYDSVNGNTKLIAEAMAEQLKVDGHDVEIVFIKDSVPSPMGDFMFVGSPTRGMKMTKGTAGFIEGLDAGFWKDRPIFMFDTVGPLSKDDAKRKDQLIMIGNGDKNASSKMRDLASRSGLTVRQTMHFAVVGMWGPLAPDATSLAKEAAHRALADVKG
jgi:flavodoxin